MKIMLVCAGGMSTGILMKKMEKWGVEHGVELSVKAYGVGEYERHVSDYDCLLLGPQISYKAKEIIAKIDGKPLDIIQSMDYALGNVENIMKQVHKMGIQ